VIEAWQFLGQVIDALVVAAHLPGGMFPAACDLQRLADGVALVDAPARLARCATDAAPPMHPYLAQGAAVAMEDAGRSVNGSTGKADRARCDPPSRDFHGLRIAYLGCAFRLWPQ
jgi:hypothetical protein